MALNGIAFPFRKGPTGFPEMVQDDELIADSLKSIILTPVGQRVMRPQFGCNAMLYVFDNNTDLLRAKVRRETLRAIQANEPRVTVVAVQVSSMDEKVIVTVSYVVNRKSGQVTVELPRTGA